MALENNQRTEWRSSWQSFKLTSPWFKIAWKLLDSLREFWQRYSVLMATGSYAKQTKQNKKTEQKKKKAEMEIEGKITSSSAHSDPEHVVFIVNRNHHKECPS